MPTPTIAMRRNAISRTPAAPQVHVVVAEPRRRVEQASRPPAASPARRGRSGGRRLLVQRRAHPRSPTPAGADRPAPARPTRRLVVLALLGIQRRQERLRMHQRDQTRHVTEAEAGDQTGLQRELLAQPQGLAHPHEVGGAAPARRRRSPGCGSAESRRRAGSGTAPSSGTPPRHPCCARSGSSGLTTNSGAPAERPIDVGQPLVQLGLVRDRWPASTCRAWRSPRCRRHRRRAWPASWPAATRLPPRPAPSAPSPGAGIDVCTPSPKDDTYATTASTGRPISTARSPRASRMVPPP